VSDEAAPVVWVDRDAASSGGSSHDDSARALASWAAARGLRLAPPGEPPATVRFDAELADRAEAELSRAQEAIGAGDADAAERALARAEELLRAHPELPQAPWLRAEVSRAWATRWLRLSPRDEARGRAAWEEAQALDGGRVTGIGENSFLPRPKVKTTIFVAAPVASRVALRVDAVPVAPTAIDAGGARYDVELAPAEHHAFATIGDRPVLASWFVIAGAEPAPVRFTAATGDGCAAELEVARRSGGEGGQGGRHVEAAGVTCPRWIAAARGDRPGSVLVARCERDACGPLLEWRVERFGPAGPPQAPPRNGGWPSWATWTFLGIGAAGATAVAIVATGVFEARPVEPRFIVGGARNE
jgi:hypothetical protein